MKILFIADNFTPERNAQASLVYERAAYWVKWGHSVTVITCAPNFPEGKVFPGYKNKRCVETVDGIRVVRVKSFISPNKGVLARILDYLSFMASGSFAALLEPYHDVIVATSPQFFTAVAGWIVSTCKRMPFVFEIRDLWPDSIIAVGAMRKSFALSAIERLELFLYRRATKIIALTPAFKDNLVTRGISGKKIEVNISGADLSRYQPRPRDHALATRLGFQPKHFVLGYIGTLGMAHGLQNVLHAAELLRGSDARFLIVGPGAERHGLMAEALRRSLDNVIFVDAQPKETMPSYWSICDAALVHLKDTPTFRTVIPSKIFEAMAMGKPILLSAPAGEASKLIESEGAGLCVPAESAVALADAVRLLHKDDNQLAAFAERSKQAAPKYSRERHAAEFARSLELVCNIVPARVATRMTQT